MNNFISHNIKYLCSVNFLSQNDFGERLGLKRSVISMYVAEKSQPKIETLQRITKEFDVNLDDFINRKLDEVNNKDLAATRGVANEDGLQYGKVALLESQLKDKDEIIKMKNEVIEMLRQEIERLGGNHKKQTA